ncbi:hypothetical protein M0R36_10300 [bacterium]|nr:hypothetical protein [bacterium]
MLKKNILIIFSLCFLFSISHAETKKEIFDLKTEKETKRIGSVYNVIPKINQGFIFTSRRIKPHLSFVLTEKNNYTLDFMITEQAFGLSLNRLFLKIIDIKCGIFVAYSLDDDYHYRNLYSGLSFSIIKF